MSRNDATEVGPRPDPQRVESIFDAALERPDGQRDDYLDAACGGDTALFVRVARLLECFDRDATALESPPPSLLEDDAPADPENAEGQRIGPYELIRKLASGGMGTVWLARRADEHFEKQVAVKLIKR